MEMEQATPHISTTKEFAFGEEESRYRLFQRDFISQEQCRDMVSLIENWFLKQSTVPDSMRTIGPSNHMRRPV